VLRAFEQVRAASPEIELLIAGDFVSPDLERAIGPALREQGIIREPYSPPDRFCELAAGVDACINLRYPAAGETSGITVRLMGTGKPVLLTRSEETARFPEDACIRIDPGVAEAAMLAEYMVWLQAHPEIAREIGARGEAYIAANHSASAAARLYFEALSSCCR
jgi:glycosyltransferase involved in cell wall biosynthesis